jgi:aminopeptidase N
MDSFIEKEISGRQSSFKLSKILYPGDSSFDVSYYKLDINVSYSPTNIKANVTVTGKSMEDNFNSFYLDFTSVLTVDSIISNGKALPFIHNDSKLHITLDETISAGSYFSVIVYYHGKPEVTGLGSFVFDSHNGMPVIWTLSEPYGAKDWWPCKDTPGDKADSSDVWITCDKTLTGVSNGILQQVAENNDGTHTYKWKNSYPISHYLISVTISNYIHYTTYYNYSPKDSMPIEHYIYPEVFDSLKSQLDKTASMIKVFSELFGEYPFIKEKYGHAQFSRGGMEHQTITSIGKFDDGVIVHELSHQWFGDKITCKDWKHIWLNEGFATFSEALYLEKTQGKDAYTDLANYHMERAKRAEGSVYVKNSSDYNQVLNGLRTYSKGCAVLHMLRGITGDSLFFKILRNYVSDSIVAYNAASTEDFQRVAEYTTGMTLDYFFNEWIYGENFPKYSVNWKYSSAGGDLYKVDISISQSGNTYPRFFTMPVQIKIITEKSDTLFTVFNNMQKQDFTIYIKGEPAGFQFDPNNVILKDISIYDPAGFLFPETFYLKQNYPNPFNSTTKISFGIPKRSYVQINIYDILGNRITSLLNQDMFAGRYNIDFNPHLFNMASGVYIIRLETENVKIAKKIILLK